MREGHGTFVVTPVDHIPITAVSVILVLLDDHMLSLQSVRNQLHMIMHCSSVYNINYHADWYYLLAIIIHHLQLLERLGAIG